LELDWVLIFFFFLKENEQTKWKKREEEFQKKMAEERRSFAVEKDRLSHKIQESNGAKVWIIRNFFFFFSFMVVEVGWGLSPEEDGRGGPGECWRGIEEAGGAA
jgi:hypothetical protein